jgi:phosphoglycolate phosphatase
MDGIIFDVDGTLWDSTDTVAKSWNQAIAEHSDLQMTVDAQMLVGLFGKTMQEIWQALFPNLSTEEQTRLGLQCFAYENALLETEPGTLYPGVYETLKELSTRHKLFIVSNCQCGYIEVFLKTSGLSEYITDHLCFGETNLPKGQTIRKLMEKHHLDDVVYVGDTLGDYYACLEADVPFLHVTYGFGKVDAPVMQVDEIAKLKRMF